MHHRRSTRAARALVAALSLIALVVLPVSAHVTIVDGSSVPAGGSAVIYFRLPHGCDGQPVNALSVQLPDGIVGAKPESIAGWTATTEMVPAQYELFGTSYTERVGTIRWEGGPLADSEFLDFGVRATFQLEPGEYAIPVVQECGAESEAWIEVPAAGQTEEDLEFPAPMITVVTGTDDGHGAAPSAAPSDGGSSDAQVDGLKAEVAALNERIAAIEAVPVAETSTGPTMALTIAALVAGLAGLGLGVVAVRRRG